jgi:hypothetical protein
MRAFVLLLCATGVTAVSAAQSPFDGTWKFNKEKSRLTGDMFSVERTADGMIRQKYGEAEVKFRTDGKEYPDPLGYTITARESGDRKWSLTTTLKGKVMGTTDFELSPDGGTLTTTATGTKPNGEPFQESGVFTRVGAGDGMFGTWKTESAEVDVPDIIIKAEADGTMLTSNADWQYTAKFKLDGKDYPVTSPTTPPGMTISARKTSDRSYETIQKKDGKPYASGKSELSADGKTLTQTVWLFGNKDAMVYVFEKGK